MFSYMTYKLVHFAGIFATLMALGGITLHVAGAGNREPFKMRKWAAMFHGLGLFLVLLGGFGLLARLQGGAPLPLWIYLKLSIWLVLGAAPVLIYRKHEYAKIIWFATFGLALAAACLALYKPVA